MVDRSSQVARERGLPAPSTSSIRNISTSKALPQRRAIEGSRSSQFIQRPGPRSSIRFPAWCATGAALAAVAPQPRTGCANRSMLSDIAASLIVAESASVCRSQDDTRDVFWAWTQTSVPPLLLEKLFRSKTLSKPKASNALGSLEAPSRGAWEAVLKKAEPESKARVAALCTVTVKRGAATLRAAEHRRSARVSVRTKLLMSEGCHRRQR